MIKQIKDLGIPVLLTRIEATWAGIEDVRTGL